MLAESYLMSMQRYFEILELQGSSLSPEQIKSIINQLVDQLIEIHRNGEVCFNINPENILINVIQNDQEVAIFAFIKMPDQNLDHPNPRSGHQQ
jgi:serine/threonine protein kinase